MYVTAVYSFSFLRSGLPVRAKDVTAWARVVAASERGSESRQRFLPLFLRHLAFSEPRMLFRLKVLSGRVSILDAVSSIEGQLAADIISSHGSSLT